MADGREKLRDELIEKGIIGKEKNKKDVLRTLLLLRSKMDPDVPCVFMELSMPEDGYLQGRWQDGTSLNQCSGMSMPQG